MSADQFAEFAANSAAANDGAQQRVAEVAVEGGRVENRRGLRSGAVQPGQHDIRTVVQYRL